MAEIVFDDVTKVYDDGTIAVKRLNLEIADGSLMVLVGPSGCGKTTALRMVAGLENISLGKIRIGDRVVNELAPKERDIAMVFQNYALYPHISVFENMAFSLRMRHYKKPDVKQRVEGASKTLGLFEMLTRKPGQLSGGQRQRVAMGRAIVREPEAFLMDEPLSNLDAKLRVQMRAEISRLQRDVDVTTIYVTHDQVEAMTMGDRVAVMRLGVLQQVDAPSDLYRNPKNIFVAGFIGSPAMNMVEATVESEDDKLFVRFGSFRLAVDESVIASRPALRAYVGRTVVLGIRPEDMEDAALRTGAPEDRRIKTTVELREDMGSEILVHFPIDSPPLITDDTRELAEDRGLDVEELESETDKTTFIARFSANTQAQIDDRIEVHVDTRTLYFFDPNTGGSIHASEVPVVWAPPVPA
ncbi:MAG TPA: sn-glycerol-3-phosphate ABC transporter ATP-binding protein UgpC [Actinomycetota bacterium]|jgi:multiple sugar transport system ATP-binding protein|nr:sn-glycerol-3-phosphate ABC transporter ATP-binding protein UgpC [Actinomycetota bacterium]